MAHLKIKLNDGSPVILCDNCNKIIRSATSGEYLNPTIYAAEYCDDCSTEIINEINKMKYELELPDGFEFDHLAEPIIGNDSGALTVIVKKKQTKNFDWFVDEYLRDATGSTPEYLRDWIQDRDLSIARNRIHNGAYNLVAWEIKIGLFRFICESLGEQFYTRMNTLKNDCLDFAHENEPIKNLLPKEFIDDLFKTK